MKRLPMSEEILSSLKIALGMNEINPEDYAVYRGVALTGNPLRRIGLPQNKARFTRNALVEAAAIINRESLPLQLQHDKQALPTGRVFQASVSDNSTGVPQLDVLFFVDAGEQRVVQKLDNGTLDQMSVSISVKKQECSSCGFDFYADKQSMMRLYMDGSCPKDHKIGQDAHLSLSGVMDLTEVSLVGKGAAPGARVVDGAEAVQQFSLSADGVHRDHIALTCITHQGNDVMDNDTKDNDGQNLDLSVQNAELEAQLKQKEARVAELEADLSIAKSKQLTHESELSIEQSRLRTATHNLEAAQAQVKALEAVSDAAKEALKLAVEANHARLGLAKAVVPDTLDDLAARLKETDELVKAKLPVGPNSEHKLNAGDDGEPSGLPDRLFRK